MDFPLIPGSQEWNPILKRFDFPPTEARVAAVEPRATCCWKIDINRNLDLLQSYVV